MMCFLEERKEGAPSPRRPLLPDRRWFVTRAEMYAAVAALAALAFFLVAVIVPFTRWIFR